MAIVRVTLERLIALLFGLVGTLATVQGLAVLAAVGSAMAIPRPSGMPGWATPLLILGALVCLALMAGGILLQILQARSGLRNVWGRIDESIPPQWLLPATVPTLVFPVIALAQSQKLVALWRDVLATIERFGGAEQITKSDGMGLLLLPAAAILFVPFLEAAAGFFLIAVPPLVLGLLAARSRRFRLESMRLVVTQWSLVGASVVGAILFGRLVDLAAPHILAAGEKEGATVLQELARGRSALVGTATAYAAVVLANAVCLWVLSSAARARDPMAVEMPAPPIADVAEPPLAAEPALAAPEPPPSAASAPEKLEDVLARYRARHPRSS